MGIPPTGARIEVEALTVLRIENGRIAENWTVWDTLGLLRQLGVVPSPEAAAAGA
jgi:predicted ester cyclase